MVVRSGPWHLSDNDLIQIENLIFGFEVVDINAEKDLPLGLDDGIGMIFADKSDLAWWDITIMAPVKG